MIQSLFDKVEETPLKKTEENQADNKTGETILSNDDSPLEIPQLNDSKIIELPASGEIIEAPAHSEILSLPEIEDFETLAVFQNPSTTSEPNTGFEFSNAPDPETINEVNEKTNHEPVLFKMPFEPESTAETVRKSGLAWSAAIALFGSVVFCLVIGWFADLLLGTSPWGIVVGIVLGSLIGFFQFFRMTSQILKNKNDF